MLIFLDCEQQLRIKEEIIRTHRVDPVKFNAIKALITDCFLGYVSFCQLPPNLSETYSPLILEFSDATHHFRLLPPLPLHTLDVLNSHKIRTPPPLPTPAPITPASTKQQQILTLILIYHRPVSTRTEQDLRLYLLMFLQPSEEEQMEMMFLFDSGVVRSTGLRRV